MHHVPRRSQGQVLLIGLMLIALVTTIVGTGVLRSTTATQSTKQAEEANKASEIARGLVEQGINDEEALPGSFTDANPTGTQFGSTPRAITDTFVYDDPIAKDGQHIFYTTSYDMTANSFGTDYFAGDLNVYYGTESGQCVQLEIMEISTVAGQDRITKRYYTGDTNPTCTFDYSGPGSLTSTGGIGISWGGRTVTFDKKVTIAVGGAKAVIVRPFFGETRLGFTTTGGGFKPQGREISSTARTIEGAERTETVYQAYPQIPLSLFATIF